MYQMKEGISKQPAQKEVFDETQISSSDDDMKAPSNRLKQMNQFRTNEPNSQRLKMQMDDEDEVIRGSGSSDEDNPA